MQFLALLQTICVNSKTYAPHICRTLVPKFRFKDNLNEIIFKLRLETLIFGTTTSTLSVWFCLMESTQKWNQDLDEQICQLCFLNILSKMLHHAPGKKHMCNDIKLSI